MTDSDWGSLMAAAQRGEAGPYRRLLDLVGVWLTRYFQRRLPMAMVEDAVQETLSLIHEKRHTFDAGRPFEPWLAAIARYKWIDRIRAMKRVTFEELDDDLSVQDHHSAVISATILETLLGELKPAQGRVIRLVKLEGFSIEEAAAVTGQSQTLVKVNIHRGLARMAAVAERGDRAGQAQL